MNNFLNRNIKKLIPYIAGEQYNKKFIKLNTNENPYSPSFNINKIIKNLSFDFLKFYPDPESLNLKKVIAKKFRILPKQVFVGNGSDEILAFSFITFFCNNGILIIPEISYEFYKVYCNLFNVNYRLIPLNSNWEVNLSILCKFMNNMILANPNSPTGHYHSIISIKNLLNNQNKHVVLIDEAYIDFGGKSCVSLIKNYNNLLIVRTFSKSRSLAGLRVGFAIGSEYLIKGLNIVKNSFNSYTIGYLDQILAIESLLDKKYFINVINKLKYTRKKISDYLIKRGFYILPSKGNFIFIKLYNNSFLKICTFFLKLKKFGILVRYFSTKILKSFIRISIGNDYEMATLIKVIDIILY